MRGWLLVLVVVQSMLIIAMGFGHREDRVHIKILEEYIRDNHLPVPAFPVKNGPIVFEIEVPVCQ